MRDYHGFDPEVVAGAADSYKRALDRVGRPAEYPGPDGCTIVDQTNLEYSVADLAAELLRLGWKPPQRLYVSTPGMAEPAVHVVVPDRRPLALLPADEVERIITEVEHGFPLRDVLRQIVVAVDLVDGPTP